MDRCKNCNAVVNPKWVKCLACGLPLNLNEQHEPTIIKDQIVNKTLKEFSENNLAIKVYSEVLKKEISFVSNEEMKNQLKEGELVTYLPHELEHLVKLRATPEEINKIHMIKEIFPKSEIVWN